MIEKPVEHDFVSRAGKSQVLDFDLISKGLYIRGTAEFRGVVINPYEIILLRTGDGVTRYVVIELQYDSRLPTLFSFKGMRESDYREDRRVV